MNAPAGARAAAAQSETPILDGLVEAMAWLILGLAPLLIHVRNIDAYRTVQATFTSLFIVVLVASWSIAVTLTGRWSETRRMPLAPPLGVLAVLALGFPFTSPSVPVSGASWVNLVLYSLMFLALSDVGARRPGMVWRLCVPLAVAFAFNGVTALMQHKGFVFLAHAEGQYAGLYGNWPFKSQAAENYFAGLQAPSRMNSGAGTLGNQNVLGGYLAATIPLFTVLPAVLLVSWRTWQEALRSRYPTMGEGRANALLIALGALMAANALVGYAALLATDTRGAWLGVGASIAGGFVVIPAFFANALRHVSPRTWTKLAVAGLVGMVALGGLAYAAGVTPTMLRNKVMSTWTIKQRLVAWQVAGLMASERPVFGQGIGTYKFNYFKYLAKLHEGRAIPEYMRHRYVQAHNDFAQAAAELGYAGLLGGLAVLGLFAAAIGRHIWRCRPPPAEGLLLMASLLGVLGMAVFAISGFPFHIAASSAAFTAVAAMAGASLWRERRERWSAARPGEAPLAGAGLPPEARWALTGSICVFAVSLMAFIYLPFRADEHTKEATDFYRQGKVGEAGNAAQQAITLDPERGDARIVLGMVLAGLGRYPEAAQQLIRSQNTFDDVLVHYYLGGVYEALGRPADAHREYLRAQSYFPEGTSVRRAVEERLKALEALVASVSAGRATGRP